MVYDELTRLPADGMIGRANLYRASGRCRVANDCEGEASLGLLLCEISVFGSGSSELAGTRITWQHRLSLRVHT